MASLGGEEEQVGDLALFEAVAAGAESGVESGEELADLGAGVGCCEENYLETFDHFSKSFLNCFKLDIFKEKLVNFNIWINNNITYVFKSFAENFSNFNLALKFVYV